MPRLIKKSLPFRRIVRVFAKKTQKTSDEEIKLALRRAKEVE